ncbi:MAG: efflux RND transporter periplasmic adaptor subunit [Pseudomonadota bacterium]
MIKQVVWSLLIVAVIGGLAYPKLKPLWLNASPKAQAASGPGERLAMDKTQSQDKTQNPMQKKPADANGSGGKSGAPLKVTTFVVVPSIFAETITATGTVLADEGVELQAETNGKVVSINFVEGAPVKQGDLLLKLNDSDLRANLDRYNYSKKLAEVRFRRYSQLLAQKMVSQDDYDSVLSEMNVQQSFIDLYKAQIEKTEIRAPFNGVVGLRYVSLGAFVSATTRIATLQRLNELKIDFAVPEKYSGRIKVGTEITFTVAGGLQKYAARIAALDPRIDSGTRTLLVRAVCANNDGRLLPGAFTNVSIPLDQIADAFLVPAEAVVSGLDEKNVFVIQDGVAERRAVETGSRTASQVHIVSGLKVGDKVITSGLQNMRAKQPVESVMEAKAVKSDADPAIKNPAPKGAPPKDLRGVGADLTKPKGISATNTPMTPTSHFAVKATNADLGSANS